jgi:hypothetical protein
MLAEAFGRMNRPSATAGLCDPMPNLTAPGPDRYHAKSWIARFRLSEPGYRHRHVSTGPVRYLRRALSDGWCRLGL